MIANDTNAIAPAMTGASAKTTLSAFLGVRSSLSASFTPSARVCSRPNGPVRLGPGRCCIRPMTRRSNQMTSSVLTSRKTKTSSALTRCSHHGVSLKSALGLSANGAAPALREVQAGDGSCGIVTVLMVPPSVTVTTSRRRRRGRRGPCSRRELVGQPHDVVGHVGRRPPPAA